LTLLLQASVLACTPSPAQSAAAAANLGTPPQIATLDDIPVLQAWLANAGAIVKGVAGNIYLQKVPQQVIDDFQSRTVGSGPIGGAKGQAILTMETQVQQIAAAWSAMSSDLSSLATQIQVANEAVVAAQLTAKTVEGNLAIETIHAQGAKAQAIDSFLMTVASASSQWQSFGAWGKGSSH
jgi:hypothetical protein